MNYMLKDFNREKILKQIEIYLHKLKRFISYDLKKFQ